MFFFCSFVSRMMRSISIGPYSLQNFSPMKNSSKEQEHQTRHTVFLKAWRELFVILLIFYIQEKLHFRSLMYSNLSFDLNYSFSANIMKTINVLESSRPTMFIAPGT